MWDVKEETEVEAPCCPEEPQDRRESQRLPSRASQLLLLSSYPHPTQSKSQGLS